MAKRFLLAALLVAGCGGDSSSGNPTAMNEPSSQATGDEPCQEEKAHAARCLQQVLQRCENSIWVGDIDCTEKGLICTTAGELSLCIEPVCDSRDYLSFVCTGKQFNGADYARCTESMESCTIDDRRSLADFGACAAGLCAAGEVTDQEAYDGCKEVFYGRLTQTCYDAFSEQQQDDESVVEE